MPSKRYYLQSALERNTAFITGRTKGLFLKSCSWREIPNLKMDVNLLLPMLALHPPRLTVLPQYPEYFEGEGVTFECSAFQNRTVEGYRFFNQDGKEILKMAPDPYQKAKMTFKVQLNSTGNYTCDYWMEKNGTMTISAQSGSISLCVTEAPAAPSLILKPKLSKYNLGDLVGLQCTVPSDTKGIKEFEYFGDRMSIQSMAVNGTTHMYSMNITEPKHMGIFKCAYVQQLSSRKVVSHWSNRVSIVVRLNVGWERMLAVGGSFITINGLIFFISHFFC
ncbi:uncharacterized protein LOC121933390 isoform X2 [Sceloporus undulatus]|uniref:uncharacterized protein LOC121933390 isoform X2 n=1 Tax=Sceloporus undulatus TaxID=8520 RepID=UPI001C4B9104|nr:uncharacterized protein LOC121933390 isoform X2 [Sceloporus undulatus]